MQAFAQFGSDLDAATQAQLARGARLVEILKQGQYKPMPAELQVISIFAVNGGYVDSLEIDQVQPFETGLHKYLIANLKSLVDEIRNTGKLEGQTEEKLKEAIAAFLNEFKAGIKAQAIGTNGAGALSKTTGERQSAV